MDQVEDLTSIENAFQDLEENLEFAYDEENSIPIFLDFELEKSLSNDDMEMSELLSYIRGTAGPISVSSELTDSNTNGTWNNENNNESLFWDENDKVKQEPFLGQDSPKSPNDEEFDESSWSPTSNWSSDGSSFQDKRKSRKVGHKSRPKSLKWVPNCNGYKRLAPTIMDWLFDMVTSPKMDHLVKWTDVPNQFKVNRHNANKLAENWYSHKNRQVKDWNYFS